MLSPFAWAIGRQAVREIDANPGQYAGRDQARGGQIMGIIGTVLLVLGIIALTVVIIGLVAWSDSSSFDQGPPSHTSPRPPPTTSSATYSVSPTSTGSLTSVTPNRCVHAVAHLAREREQLGCAGAAAVGQRERVLGRER